MHFEQMATAYAEARPPYPDILYDTLEHAGVIGDGRQVLEVGAGAGLATRELARRGCRIVAVEPGVQLAALLRAAVPEVEVVVARLEDAELPDGRFYTVVAATSLHWVDLTVGLPKLHQALRPGGWLAVWRAAFGDDTTNTEFRDRVDRIVARRAPTQQDPGREQRPTVDELTAGGWFDPVRTERWRWSIDMTADQIRRLFSSFSNWTTAEVAEAERAVIELGWQVSEHYQTVLHLLQRRSPAGQG